MATSAITRDYTFSDAELKERVDALIIAVKRDSKQFTPRGIDAERLTEFAARNEEFDELFLDSYYSGNVNAAIAATSAARAALEEKLKTLRTSVVNSKVLTLARKNCYGIDNLTQYDDIELLKVAKNATKIAKLDCAVLTKSSITPEFIEELSDLRKTFDDIHDSILDHEGKRSLASEDRVIKGNALYETIVEFCNIGKDLFATKSPSKYSDYLIYEPAGPSAIRGVPENLHFDGSTHLRWDPIDNATSYGVSVSKNGGKTWLQDISSDDPITEVPTELYGKVFYRVRGRNATGFGAYSSVFERLFGLQAPEDFVFKSGKFTWKAVEFATNYELEVSVMGSGVYSLISTTDSTSYVTTPATGSWTYRIRAVAGNVIGNWLELNVAV